MEASLIHWHASLKSSSENRNPQIPEIGRKNRISLRTEGHFLTLTFGCLFT